MTNQIKTLLLLGVLSALLIGFGSLLSPGMFYAMTGLAVVMNLGAYFFSDKIVLKLHGAREVSAAEAPALHGIVEEVAARAGIPKPRVFVMDGDHANAFATGRTPSKGVVAVTRGLLAMMTPREIRGVVAHEMAHIRNRDILVASVAAAVAAAVAYLANIVQWGALLGVGQHGDGEEGESPIGALALAFVAPIAATLIQLGVSRSREYLADETAARLTGDPVGLANALQRLSAAAGMLPAQTPTPATASLFIVNPLAGGGALLNLFSTHPPAEKRVARLLAMAGLVRAA